MEVTKKLIQKINREHKAASANLAAYREHARSCGSALIKAKSEVARGGWLDWLRKNCPDLSERTARQYMSFARGDTDTLMSGGVRKTPELSSDYSEPDESEDDEPDETEELADPVEDAIEQAKSGTSLEDISKNVRMRQKTLMRIPEMRDALEEGSPDVESLTVRESDVFCETPTVKDFIEGVENATTHLFELGRYKIGKKDRERLRTIYQKGLDALESLDG